jgi:mono/diheme cytochrome c family protein
MPDLVTSKLPALRAYQLSLPAPPAPTGSFDKVAATRGRAVFGENCMSCHVGGDGTDNNGGKLHAPEETGMDGAYAARTVNKAYRIARHRYAACGNTLRTSTTVVRRRSPTS